MLEALAGRGHECQVVAPACGFQASASLDTFHEMLARRGVTCQMTRGAEVFTVDGVRVTSVTDPRTLLSRLGQAIRDERPDLVLVASEDPGQLLLETALRAEPARVIYVARTTLGLPFGPGTIGESFRGIELVRRTAGVIVVSRFLERYFRLVDVTATVLPISLHGAGPFPELGRHDRGAITMVNPCGYKGLPIFLALARLFPDLAFAAVPTWGTTARDLQELRALPNVQLLEPADDIEAILAVTRALLVPSLWVENKSRTITEAMLRGIPVLASDVGGNGEAMLGVDYLLPVRPIAAYENRVDERMLPIPVIPDQDIAPWAAALSALLADEASYRRTSRAARAAALAACAQETIDPVEAYFADLACRLPTGYHRMSAAAAHSA